MAVINELVTSFGFKGNINPLKDFNKELGGIIPKMAKMKLGMAGVASLGTIFAGLTNNNPLVQSAKRMGEMVKDIQALELASVKFGANMGVGLSTFENVSKSLAEIEVRGQKTFGKFGISIFNQETGELKNVKEMLSGVNELFNSQHRRFGKQGKNRVKVLALRELDINESLLNFLMLSTEEYAKQLKMAQQFAASQNQAKSIGEFNNSLSETKVIISQISTLVTSDFGNSFKKIIDGANDFLKANKEIVLEISAMALKIGLVAGGLAGLKVLAKGLTLVFGGMFAPVIAGLAVLNEVIQNKKQLSYEFKFLAKNIKRSEFGKVLGFEQPKKESSSKLVNDLNKSIGNSGGIFSLKNKKFDEFSDIPRLNGRTNGSKGISQTNNINVYTDSPKVMRDVIENTINKGARVIQETSTRGGI